MTIKTNVYMYLKIVIFTLMHGKKSTKLHTYVYVLLFKAMFKFIFDLLNYGICVTPVSSYKMMNFFTRTPHSKYLWCCWCRVLTSGYRLGHIGTGMSGLTLRLASNGTNPGLFQIIFQYILAHRAKMYWNLIWRSPGFCPSWGQSDQIWIPNLTSLVHICTLYFYIWFSSSLTITLRKNSIFKIMT